MLKILVIDARAYYEQLGLVLGQSVELIAEVDDPMQSNFALYSPTAATFDWIQSQPECDVIILGNNVKAGLKKARYLTEAQIAKTVVVWQETPTDAGTAEYRQLGFKHFSSRTNVNKAILAMIGT
jgi:hypothetical protein